MATQDESSLRPLDVTQLEERILMSATPLAVVAQAPDMAGTQTTDAVTDDGIALGDQQLLDVVADAVLPAQSVDGEAVGVSAVGDSGVSGSLPAATEHTVELVFIDSSISDLDQMIADLESENAQDNSRSLEIIVLDSQQDGVAQITSALLRYDGIDGIHIVSHGSDGKVQLGATTLSSDSIDAYRSALTAWQYSMSDKADLLFYGCNLAATEDGQALMNQLAAECDCDVAASDDLTGHSDLGGDWDLEFQAGDIETQLAFSSELQQNWSQVLTLAVDASSSGATPNQASVTVSHTTSGTNRLMLVGVSTDPHGETVASVTYNGDSLTLVGSEEDPGAHSRVEIWSLLVPDTGTHDVVVTMSGAGHHGTTVGVMTFTGVDQATPLVNFSSAFGSSTAASTTVTSATDDLVFGVVGSHGGSSAAQGVGQTEYWDNAANSTNGSGTLEAGAASVTTSWTVNNDDWSVAAVSIQEAPEAPMITARETVGADANGQIDRIRITTDENLDDDFSGLTITVAGYTVTGYSTGVANDNIFYVDLTESSSGDTGATPDVIVTANSTLSKVGEVLNMSVDGWWDTDWLNRTRITFDNIDSAVNLTDFPVLVNLTAADVDFARIKAGGADIRFVDDDGTALDYEIEAWDDGTETATVWVRVQQLDQASNTDFIHLYYNNAAAVDAQNAAGVWDANYESVWHLNDDFLDSTSNNLDATNNGSTDGVGIVADGQDFDGTDDYIQSSLPSFLTDIGANDFTIEFMFNADDVTSTGTRIRLFDIGDDNDEFVQLVIDDAAAGKLTFTVEDNGIQRSVAVDTNISTGTWYHAVGVWDASTNDVDFYLNGIEQTTAGVTNNSPGSIQGVTMGRRSDGVASTYYEGLEDEFRISNTIRSADWIEAAWLSQNGVFAFSNFGSEETVRATDAARAVLISASTPQSTGSNLFQAEGQQLNLVFSETLGGTISEVNLEAALLFAAGATDGDNLPTIGTGANPISLVTTTQTNDTLRVTWNANNTANADWLRVGTHTVQVVVGTNITDTSGYVVNTAAAAVTITGDTNDAPVLDSTGTMALTTINEDDFASSGDTVANIILSAGGDRITDVDTTPVEGMAIIGVDDANGTWQYNTGSGWATFGAVSNSSAVLLNPTALIRFVPDADYAGSSGNITFRAWDQTSGSNGDTAVDVSTNGAATAYSTNTEVASLTVTNINDAPVITSSGTPGVAENQTAVVTVISTDVDGGAPTYSLSGGADQARFSINATTGELTFSTAPDFESPTDAGTNNVYEVQVTADDGAGGGDVQLVSVTVTGS
ncbi:MAG: DUF2341 domain-containing protein, partial [Fuerstiella sp.]|nr:DUF2341 domain-containing protein [Fuerstiella sp.]